METLRLTLTEILPSSLGKCAARNQSPGSGLVTLNAPVVRFGRVHVRVTAKDPGTTVSRGNWVYSGLITGGAPDLKYLLITKPKFNPCHNSEGIIQIYDGSLILTTDNMITDSISVLLDQKHRK